MAQRTHVATYLDEATIQRIDGWAEKLGVSRSGMVKLLTESAIQDEAWIIDMVTSKAGLKVASFLKSVGMLKPREETPQEPQGALKAT